MGKVIDANSACIQSVATTVTKLEGAVREQEIARMLAGSESQTSLEHAHELLTNSRKMLDGLA